MLIRIEWAAALLELGEERAALDQLHRAAVAARLALEVDIPQPLWRLDARVCRDLVDFVLQAYGEPATVAAVPLGTLDAHRVELLAAGDVEVVPMLDAFVALALLRSGRRLEALARLAEEAPRSMVAGAGSFPAWARAQALAGDAPDAALRAQRDYGARVARDRWNARLGMLAAARAGIAHRRLSLEHAVLARDVLLDPLTGLSNRRCFDDWLADVPDRPRGTALLLIDLDDFKVVNDLHGHAVGDEALRKVGRVIAGHVRPGDMALRLGGDEFALVLFDDVPEVPAPAVEALRAVAADRARALRTAVELSDWGRIAPGLTLTLSVGLAAAVLGPESPGGAARLYREADADLYVQKDHADVSVG
jgi:diguanylate cyclase (GGDEF)-like protein